MRFSGLEALAADGSVSEFAHANGLRYQRRSRLPALSGGRFERFTNAKVRGSVSGAGWIVGALDVGDGVIRRDTSVFGVPVTVATSGLPVSRPNVAIGYLALTLPRQLPNMILDSKRNNRAFGSSLLHPPSRDQRLSLEGDFDTYFDLFVPSGYERDALYIFTPDLMALLIDETADVDVEIRGNQLVVYVLGGLDLSLPATWRWIERVMSVVGAATSSRARRYADERIESTEADADAVANAGQRLRRGALSADSRGVALAVVVAIVVVIAAVLVTVWFNR
jgi:hypothetical protein